MENRNLDQEDYLDTLDRKVTEIINRDSRRSSQHDLVIKDDDIYGSMSLTYSRTRLGSDLNSNPRYSLPPAPEGTIMFEDDGKESSSEPEEDEITPEMIENAKKRDRKAKMLKMLDIEMKF